MIWDAIERAHLTNVPPIDMRITYGWPIPESIINKGIDSTGFFRSILRRTIDTESSLSQSTAGDIETLNASMIVFAKTDKKAYEELMNWLQAVWYETETGKFGKPAISSKSLGSGADVLIFRDWTAVGGFDPDIFEAGDLFGAAQNVIIEVENI